jgi:hypothetical protein
MKSIGIEYLSARQIVCPTLGGSIIAAVTMCAERAGSTNRRDVR